MNKNLKNLGFELAGKWENSEANKDYFLVSIDEKYLDKINFLYAFVINDQVMYVGRSYRTVRKKLVSGWARYKKKFKKKPSHRGRRLYDALVSDKKNVEIYLSFPFDKIEISGISMPDEFKAIDKELMVKAAKKGILKEMRRNAVRAFRDKGQCGWN